MIQVATKENSQPQVISPVIYNLKLKNGAQSVSTFPPSNLLLLVKQFAFYTSHLFVITLALGVGK